MRYGSFESWQGNLSISRKIKDFSFSFHGNYFQTGGWLLKERGEADVTLKDGKVVYLKDSSTLLMKQENYGSVLQVGYKGFSFQYLYTQTICYNNQISGPIWSPYFKYMTSDEHYTDLGYKNTWGKFSLNANVGYTKTVFTSPALTTPPPDYFHATPYNLLTELYLQYAATSNLHISAGGTYNHLYDLLKVKNRTS